MNLLLTFYEWPHRNHNRTSSTAFKVLKMYDVMYSMNKSAIQCDNERKLRCVAGMSDVDVNMFVLERYHRCSHINI